MLIVRTNPDRCYLVNQKPCSYRNGVSELRLYYRDLSASANNIEFKLDTNEIALNEIERKKSITVTHQLSIL